MAGIAVCPGERQAALHHRPAMTPSPGRPHHPRHRTPLPPLPGKLSSQGPIRGLPTALPTQMGVSGKKEGLLQGGMLGLTQLGGARTGEGRQPQLGPPQGSLMSIRTSPEGQRQEQAHHSQNFQCFPGGLRRPEQVLASLRTEMRTSAPLIKAFPGLTQPFPACLATQAHFCVFHSQLLLPAELCSLPKFIR